MGAQINQLTATTPSSGQQLPVYDPTKGDTRRVSFDDIRIWMQANLTFPSAGRPEPNTQYAAPSASGFSVAIADADDDVHLILTPTAGFAAGTIVLPSVANVRDKQLVIVNCTQQVVALTINKNGAVAVTGAPTALAADDFFTLKYDLLMQTWYCIG